MSVHTRYHEALLGRLTIPGLRSLRYVLLTGLLLIIIGFTGIVSEYSATAIAIDILFALGVSYPLGQAGIGSFGNQLFFGAGGYALGYLVTRQDFANTILLLLAATAVGALLAIIQSALIRGSGALGFGLITLAIAQAVYIFVYQSPYLYGSNGLFGIAGNNVLGLNINTGTGFFYLTSIFVLITVAGVTVLSDSMLGQAIRASRQSPARALALGIPVRRYRVAAYVVGGAISGLAGGLFALQVGSVNPDAMFYWTVGAVPILAGLVGGIRTISGPIIGGALVGVLTIVLTSYTTAWQLYVGLVILLLGLSLPTGIVPGISRAWKRAIRLWLPQQSVPPVDYEINHADSAIAVTAESSVERRASIDLRESSGY